jgi:N utilization substance protein B
MKSREKFATRTRARRRALQGIYQWYLNRQAAEEIVAQFLLQQDFSNVDEDLFRRLVSGVIKEEGTIGEKLTPALDRPIEQVDLMEKIVLMMGMYEMMYCLDTPWRVVLDEAVELAKKFGSEQGHTYVNAVLDKAAAGLGKV